MKIFETKINIMAIRNIVNAAEALQEAGETSQANAALKTLADSILAQLPPTSQFKITVKEQPINSNINKVPGEFSVITE